MFVDALGLLSDAQALTTDTVSTNTIDLGNVTPKNDIGDGEPMCLAIAVDVAATGGGVYEFHLCQSANANLTSDDELVTRVIAEADLSAGSVHYLPIPPGAITKRYIGLKFDNVSGTTGVTVTAFLQPMSMIQRSKVYADGITIS
jgi:hypothetical protein